MDKKADEAKEAEKESPALCVCGGAPVLTKWKRGYMYSCRNITICATRGQWASSEQKAVHSWNVAAETAKANNK